MKTEYDLGEKVKYIPDSREMTIVGFTPGSHFVKLQGKNQVDNITVKIGYIRKLKK